LKFKRLSVLFAIILALSTFFSSFAFAETNTKKNLVALGDSITFGWNLAQDHTTPSTLAFPYLIDSDHYNVTKNISFPGWTSKQLLEAIQTPENQEAIKNANVITLDIGSNDLLQTPEIAQILKNPTVPPTQDQINAATQAVEKPAEDLENTLETIVYTITDINPDAPIILYNLYNPFGNDNPTFHALGEQIIPQINKGINDIAIERDLLVADAYTAFNGHQSEYILPNDIHPNSTGHQVLASLANDILTEIEPLTIDLTPSTTDQTKDPVTIKVSTNSKKVSQMKWLPGEKTAEDFMDAGTPVMDNQFQVTENGKYTVYVMDTWEYGAVKTIEITNITKDNGNPTPNPGDNGNHNPTPITTTSTPTPTAIPTATTPSGSGHALPNTATSMFNYVAIGLVLVLAGLASMKLQQYRRREND
jgi:lysophospholipase L1-like esterase